MEELEEMNLTPNNTIVLLAIKKGFRPVDVEKITYLDIYKFLLDKNIILDVFEMGGNDFRYYHSINNVVGGWTAMHFETSLMSAIFDSLNMLPYVQFDVVEKAVEEVNVHKKGLAFPRASEAKRLSNAGNFACEQEVLDAINGAINAGISYCKVEKRITIELRTFLEVIGYEIKEFGEATIITF